MAPSLPKNYLLLPVAVSLILLLLLLPQASSKRMTTRRPILTNHRGPILTKKVNLAILWYGRFGKTHKSVIRSFIKSLNNDGNANLEPKVSTWWRTVESYQAAAFRNRRVRRSPAIRVKVVRQVTDNNYSVGKIITQDFVGGLVNKATGGSTSCVAVIFTSRQVTVQGLCMGKCSQHGVIGAGPSKKLYIIVGNPESECPGTCAWPFHKADFGPQGVTYQPPNRNVGADAMAISFASALAGTVTNPFNTGFYQGPKSDPLEAATACVGIFGTGAFPGYPGKIRVDPHTGGCFNAHGVKGKKFLLPAVWNPMTRSCWTTM